MPETTAKLPTVAAPPEGERVVLVEKHEKPRRPIADVERDLAAAQAKFRDLHKRVEGEQVKVNRMAALIDRAKVQHAATFGTAQPWDPSIYSPPLVPYTPDAALQREFHQQHYVVAELEREQADHYEARKKGLLP